MPSPMMTQFYEIKKDYPNEILFFRLGDFYEMFADDAVVASAILEVVLTRRKNSVDGEIPMCGVPYHAAENYIAKLIQAGKSVAICEQGEAPTPGSKLVNRAVVRVVTPGTVQLEGVIDQTRPNYIASIHHVGNVIACALVDVSTGEMRTCSSTEEGFHERLKTYQIREVIYPESLSIPWKHAFQDTLFVPQSKWSFDLARGWKMVCEHFGVASLEGFGYAKDDAEVGAVAAALSYVKYTQKSDLQHILEIEKESSNTSLVLDSSTLRNLEMFAPSHYSPNSKCVFDVVNDTKNPMGARFLRRTFQNPLTDISRITERQSQVQRFVENQPLREHTRQKLSEIMDIERVLGKLSSGLGGPRDLGNLRDSLSAMPFLKESVPEKDRVRFQDYLDKLTALTNELHRALRSELPRLAREGGFVQEGYHDHIDELLQLSQGGKDWITEYQDTERIRTSIPSLKVSYNRVFGYYIEVTKTHADKAPDDYFKKQTLVNAERYATQTLKVFEEKILSAEQTLLEEELQVFMELEKQVLSQVSVLQAISQIIAEVDLVQSFAETANRFQYTRPTIVEESKIRIEQGRHPVAEAILDQDFTPNDTKLDVNENRCMILTGPNMGGKSTYIRQVALICLMAHTGSFVPAAQAEIGILDRIFTRVGASDNLSEGQSTFMVEMLEVSNILRNATSKSLVILDEVGRGTSTYDGLSLAQAITESLTQETKCQTLFATHYHELLKLEHSIQWVRNYCILVDKDEEGIRFLHQISAGGADESYGIDIAKLAGFPDNVLQRATHILETLELEKSIKSQSNLFERNTLPNHPKEPIHDSVLVNELRKIDVNQLTPLESLHKLALLKELGETSQDE